MSKLILIIDDEDEFCKIVKNNLELDKAFEVAIANNGKEGIKLAKKLKPDLVLLDIIMPEMNGFQVLETLKKDLQTITIPVVMLTAKGDDYSKIKAAGLYDDRYIVKPVEAAVLKNKIMEVLS
jgi:two-component system phosphate regulon response regulator PhoB